MGSKIIAFANQKGGVGKTTSCVNVAASMSSLGKKVLLVDLDSQGNATMGSGVNKNELDYTVNDVLTGELGFSDVVIKKTVAGYDLLPANCDLTGADLNLVKKSDKEQSLKKALLPEIKNYDFVFLDCPPALNMVTLNAFVAADSIIIPMQCEYYALEGLSALMGTISQVRQALNKNLCVEGIIQTMFDARNRLSLDVSNQLKLHFKDKLYKNVVPRNVRLAEAPSHGLPIILYDKSSRGAVAYLKLATEILKRANKKIKNKEKSELECI